MPGIGKAIVDIILSKYAHTKVIAIARSGDKLKELVKQYGDDRIGIVVGDVTKSSTSTEAIKLAKDKFGQINSLILNAGVLDPVGKIDEVKVEQWKTHFDINLFSLVDIIQQSIGELRKTNGNIIAVSSGASTSHYSGWYAYGCGKAAVDHLMMSIAVEEPLVTTSAIAPGVVNTEMQQDIRNVFSKNMQQEVAQKFHDLHKNDELLAPEVPGAVYANLAVQGITPEINGKYLRWDDEILQKYT